MGSSCHQKRYKMCDISETLFGLLRDWMLQRKHSPVATGMLLSSSGLTEAVPLLNWLTWAGECYLIVRIDTLR